MIRIRLKNRSYGFMYAEALTKVSFTETKIPVENDSIATTMEFAELADNHCACICTMNTTLLLKANKLLETESLDISEDRVELFKEIHDIFGNGPVIWFKPKFDRFFRSKGSRLRAVPIKRLEAFEESIKANIPVGMLVNAGITKWHWVLVIGIRKYEDGSIYLNILDGWNKRNDRFIRYEGRKTFIRALKPVLK